MRKYRPLRIVTKTVLWLMTIFLAFCATCLIMMYTRSYLSMVDHPAVKALGGRVVVDSMIMHRDLTIVTGAHYEFPPGTPHEAIEAAIFGPR